MTWMTLLLADPSPSLRILVLKNLLNKDENDSEIKELREIQMEDQIIEKTLKTQLENGSWASKSTGTIATGGNLQLTSQILVKLAYLEFQPTNEIIDHAVNFIFSKQKMHTSENALEQTLFKGAHTKQI